MSDKGTKLIWNKLDGDQSINPLQALKRAVIWNILDDVIFKNWRRIQYIKLILSRKNLLTCV